MKQIIYYTQRNYKGTVRTPKFYIGLWRNNGVRNRSEAQPSNE